MDELRWSDDEVPSAKRPDDAEDDSFASDYESDEERIDPSVTNGRNSKDYKRSRLFTGAVKINTTIIDENINARAPRAINPKLPLPQLPSSVAFNLEKDFISFLWSEFIANGADASELIEYQKIGGILRQCELFLGLELPPSCLEFKDTELDDYVDFKDVCEKFSQFFGANMEFKCLTATQNQIIGLPPCCGRASCRACKQVTDHATKSEGSATLDSDDSATPNARDQSIFFAYSDWLTRMHGKLRNKHLSEILDVMRVPYDRNRLPLSWWELRGEFLIPSYEEFRRLVDAVRTDADDVEDEGELEEAMKLPLWIRQELDHPDIIVLRCYFLSVCGGVSSQSMHYTIGRAELVQLCKAMGGWLLSTEKASAFIERHSFSKRIARINFLGFVTIFLKVKRGAIKDDALVAAYKTARTKLKLFEEIDDLIRFPTPSAALLTYGGSPFSCDLSISGPVGYPYEGGSFHVRVTFPDDYPFSPPEVVFRTEIYSVHIMVKLDGTGILPHLKYVWDPSWNIKRLLDHISTLLQAPDPSLVSLHLVDIAATWAYQRLTNPTAVAMAMTNGDQVKSEAKASAAYRPSKPQSAASKAESKQLMNGRWECAEDGGAADDNYADDFTSDAVDELWAMDQHAAGDKQTLVVAAEETSYHDSCADGSGDRRGARSSDGSKSDGDFITDEKELTPEDCNNTDSKRDNSLQPGHSSSSGLSGSNSDDIVFDQNDALQELMQLLPEDYTINPDIEVEESLAALTKTERIHASMLCTYLRSPETYSEMARQFVRRFAFGSSTGLPGAANEFDERRLEEGNSQSQAFVTNYRLKSTTSDGDDDYYYYDNGFESCDDIK